MVTVLLNKYKFLLVGALTYLIIGMLIFSYDIIQELNMFPYEGLTPNMPERKKGYYKHHIYVIILALSILNFFLLIIAFVFIILFRRLNKSIDARSIALYKNSS